MFSVAGLFLAFDMMSFIAWSLALHKALKGSKGGLSAPPLAILRCPLQAALITYAKAQGTARSTDLSLCSLQRRSEKVRFAARPKVRAGLAWHARRVRYLYAGAAASGVARIFNRPSFRLDLGDAGPTFYFHDLIPQKCCALEFEICRGALHLVFEFTQQFGNIEIATGFLNNGGGNLAAAQNRVQTLLHGAADSLWRDSVLFVVFHLFGPAIVRDRHQRFHALGNLIGKQNDFAVYMSSRAARGLDE